MIRHTVLLLVAILAFPAAVFAEGKLTGQLRSFEIRDNVHRSSLAKGKKIKGRVGSRSPVKRRTHDEKNYQIEVEVSYRGLEGETSFVVLDGTQANHVLGGDKHFRIGKNKKGVEYKRWGFIVNVLPVAVPGRPGKVQVQIQVELSGPTGPGEIKDIDTWQYQSTALLTEGKSTVLVRKPARLEIKITSLK